MEHPEVARAFLLFFLLPLWIVIGALDWWTHRVTKIEQTSGPTESILHLILLAVAGGPIILGLLFEIKASSLLIMIACFVLHEVLGYCDVAYARKRREITAFEQRLHDYLTAIPLAALSLLIVLYWDRFALIWHYPALALQSPFQPKDAPLSPYIVVGVPVLVALFNLIPFLEEAWRGYHARAKTQRNR